MTHPDHLVALLGASNKPERYAHKALTKLTENGYPVIPIHPTLTEVDGFKVLPNLEAIDKKIDTLTLYVGPARIEPLIESIVKLNPGRVIMNPGTESEPLGAALTKAGIPFEHACTLVLLGTGQF